MLRGAEAVPRPRATRRSRRSTSTGDARPVATSPPRRSRSRRRSTSSSASRTPRARGARRAEAERRRSTPRAGAGRQQGDDRGAEAEVAGRADGADRRRRDELRQAARPGDRGAASSKLPGLLPDAARGRARDYAQKPRVYKIKARATSAAALPSAPPTSGSSRGRRSASTTASRARRWKDPPILDNPTETQDDRRPRLRALLRRRPAAAGRLADRQRLLLGLEHAARSRSPNDEMLGIAAALPAAPEQPRRRDQPLARLRA